MSSILRNVQITSLNDAALDRIIEAQAEDRNAHRASRNGRQGPQNRNDEILRAINGGEFTNLTVHDTYGRPQVIRPDDGLHLPTAIDCRNPLLYFAAEEHYEDNEPGWTTKQEDKIVITGPKDNNVIQLIDITAPLEGQTVDSRPFARHQPEQVTERDVIDAGLHSINPYADENRTLVLEAAHRRRRSSGQHRLPPLEEEHQRTPDVPPTQPAPSPVAAAPVATTSQGVTHVTSAQPPAPAENAQNTTEAGSTQPTSGQATSSEPRSGQATSTDPSGEAVPQPTIEGTPAATARVVRGLFDEHIADDYSEFASPVALMDYSLEPGNDDGSAVDSEISAEPYLTARSHYVTPPNPQDEDALVEELDAAAELREAERRAREEQELGEESDVELPDDEPIAPLQRRGIIDFEGMDQISAMFRAQITTERAQTSMETRPTDVRGWGAMRRAPRYDMVGYRRIRYAEDDGEWFATVVKTMGLDPRIFAEMDKVVFHRIFKGFKEAIYPDVVAMAFPKLLYVTEHGRLRLYPGQSPACPTRHFQMESLECKRLPLTALVNMLSFLDRSTLMRLRHVCKDWMELADHHVVHSTLALDTPPYIIGHWVNRPNWRKDPQWLRRCSETVKNLRVRGHATGCAYLDEFLEAFTSVQDPPLEKLTIFVDDNFTIEVANELPALETVVVRAYHLRGSISGELRMNAPRLHTVMAPLSMARRLEFPKSRDWIPSRGQFDMRDQIRPAPCDPLRNSEHQYVIIDKELRDYQKWNHYVQWAPVGSVGRKAPPISEWADQRAIYGSLRVPKHLFTETVNWDEEGDIPDEYLNEEPVVNTGYECWDYAAMGEPRWPQKMVEVADLLRQQTLQMIRTYPDSVLRTIMDAAGEVDILDTWQKPNEGWRQLMTYGCWKPFPGWVQVLPVSTVCVYKERLGLTGNETLSQTRDVRGAIVRKEYFSDSTRNGEETLGWIFLMPRAKYIDLTLSSWRKLEPEMPTLLQEFKWPLGCTVVLRIVHTDDLPRDWQSAISMLQLIHLCGINSVVLGTSFTNTAQIFWTYMLCAAATRRTMVDHITVDGTVKFFDHRRALGVEWNNHRSRQEEDENILSSLIARGRPREERLEVMERMHYREHDFQSEYSTMAANFEKNYSAQREIRYTSVNLVMRATMYFGTFWRHIMMEMVTGFYTMQTLVDLLERQCVPDSADVARAWLRNPVDRSVWMQLDEHATHDFAHGRYVGQFLGEPKKTFTKWLMTIRSHSAPFYVPSEHLPERNYTSGRQDYRLVVGRLRLSNSWFTARVTNKCEQSGGDLNHWNIPVVLPSIVSAFYKRDRGATQRRPIGTGTGQLTQIFTGHVMPPVTAIRRKAPLPSVHQRTAFRDAAAAERPFVRPPVSTIIEEDENGEDWNCKVPDEPPTSSNVRLVQSVRTAGGIVRGGVSTPSVPAAVQATAEMRPFPGNVDFYTDGESLVQECTPEA